MPFRDLDEWFDSSLKLPIRGKTYRIESVDAETGLWAQRLVTAGQQVARAERSGKELDESALPDLRLDDEEEQSLYARLMGETFDEMIADHLPWEVIKLAGTTALFWAALGLEVAERYWNAGGSPEASRPEPQDRKAPARSARRASTGSKRTPAVVPGEVVTPGATSSSTGA